MDYASLLEQWQRGLRIVHKAHQQAAVQFEQRARWLSVATVIASTAVGTSLFADANANLTAGWKIGAGLLSLLAAILSAVQGTLKYSELVVQHRAAAQRYGPLRREVDELLADAALGGAITHDIVTDLRKRWDTVDADSPNIPQKLYDAVVASLPATAAPTVPTH